MYNNTDNLKVGKDYYRLSDGQYMFTWLYNDYTEERLEVDGIPHTIKSEYGDYHNDVVAYNKETKEYFTDVYDVCYEDILVTKERLDEINIAKQVLMNIWKQSGIQEPFIYEDGKFSVGKEQVLSAHINAGYSHGWISSSICW